MREIKFRAWDVENKSMIKSFTHAGKASRFYTCYFNKPISYEVMQYTGLKDKKGNDIYEGDIVEIIHPCWSNKCVVEFLNGSFFFKSKEIVNENTVVPGFSFMLESWKIKIMGNIYKNHNLPKRENN